MSRFIGEVAVLDLTAPQHVAEEIGAPSTNLKLIPLLNSGEGHAAQRQENVVGLDVRPVARERAHGCLKQPLSVAPGVGTHRSADGVPTQIALSARTVEGHWSLSGAYSG